MISCIVVDDEPWAAALVKDYIEKTPFLSLAGEFTNPLEALQYLKDHPVGLVFLDIQMPELTGIQFMKIMGNAAQVILTTAYGEYALDSYEYNVADYLLKPISFERFYTAALKARTLLQLKPEISTPGSIQTPGIVASEPFIFIKTDSRFVKVFVKDILFVEGLKDYIAVHTAGEKLVALDNLKTIGEALSKNQFVRVHKSFVVALEKIDVIERNRIFIGAQVIPIGDTYRDALHTILKEKQFGGK